jgi:hypothetical protein
MRIETLSDHVGEQSRQLAKKLNDNALQLVRYRDRLKQAMSDLHAARLRKGLLRWALRLPSAEERRAQWIVEGLRRAIVRTRRRQQVLQRTRSRTASGLRGEERFRRRLSRLSDEWTCLTGYKNDVGEIDAILIGPRSVWAVEVKSHRARLHVDGDEWWLEKDSPDGNVVKTRRAVSGSGRNWGRQASDPARRLESWLGRNGFPLRIRTAVVLTNPYASLGRIRNPQVDLVTCDPYEVVRSRRFHCDEWSETDREAIAALIRQDHRNHWERRLERRAAWEKTRRRPR